MSSPARRSYQAKVAALAAGVASVANSLPEIAADNPAAGEYRTLLIALGVDLDRLRNIQSVERKIEAKRELIETYRAWVSGARTRGTAVRDEIVTTVMVWAIDIGDWTLALDLASYVLGNRLDLPERYQRTPGCLVAEEIAEAALADPAAVPRAVLVAAQDLTEAHDMPDEARAKLHKALGRAFARDADAFDPDAASAMAGGKAALLAAARDHFARALALNPKAGVKKDIDAVERALRAPAS